MGNQVEFTLDFKSCKSTSWDEAVLGGGEVNREQPHKAKISCLKPHADTCRPPWPHYHTCGNLFISLLAWLWTDWVCTPTKTSTKILILWSWTGQQDQPRAVPTHASTVLLRCSNSLLHQLHLHRERQIVAVRLRKVTISTINIICKYCEST